MDLFIDFVVNSAAGLVGVFAGVVLALWTERKREGRQHVKDQVALDQDLAQSRRVLLTSVVQNTYESKKLGAALEQEEDPYLFQVSFELAAWDATKMQFVRHASLDERVLFSRFFDQVARLMRLTEFHRQLRIQLELRQTTLDAGDRELLAQSARRIHSVADEARIDGIIIVNDLGEPMHKRLLGMNDLASSS